MKWCIKKGHRTTQIKITVKFNTRDNTISTFFNAILLFTLIIFFGLVNLTRGQSKPEHYSSNGRVTALLTD